MRKQKKQDKFPFLFSILLETSYHADADMTISILINVQICQFYPFKYHIKVDLDVNNAP